MHVDSKCRACLQESESIEASVADRELELINRRSLARLGKITDLVELKSTLVYMFGLYKIWNAGGILHGLKCETPFHPHAAC